MAGGGGRAGTAMVSMGDVSGVNTPVGAVATTSDTDGLWETDSTGGVILAFRKALRLGFAGKLSVASGGRSCCPREATGTSLTRLCLLEPRVCRGDTVLGRS